MSLAELGGEDLSRSFLSLVELGRSRISLRALALVAERLELPLSHFVDDTHSEAVAELELDRAEAALAKQQPDEALRILDETDVTVSLRPRALWLRGRALTDAGRPREAIPVLQEALELAETQKDTALALQVRYKLGAALYLAGNYDEAMTQLRHALDVATDHPQDPILLGKITVAIGHILYVRGEISAAIERYTRARELFSRVGDLDNLAAVYSGLSLASKANGDLGGALRYSKLSLGAFEAKQNARLAAAELNNLATSYQEIGDIDHAIEAAVDAVSRAQEIRAPDVEALARSTLAALYLRQGNYDDAEREANKAVEIAAGDTDLARIDGWIVLAELAERSGDRERADRLYTQALTQLKESGKRIVYAEAALGYSLLLRSRGDSDRALEYALESAQAKAARPA
jgi:tetratricopeptide (TPR) repeat protein